MMIKLGLQPRGGVLASLISRTIPRYTGSNKLLMVCRTATQCITKICFCTKTDKNMELLSLEADSSSVVSLGKYTSLFPALKMHPPPPTGKLNLIKNDDVIQVTPDEMYDKLRHLPSEYVLQTFAANVTSMDKVHFAISLKRLNAVIHRLSPDSRDQYIEDLLKDDRFQVLVAVITRKGRYYSADVQYNILRSLQEFGFPASHPSMKVFLALTRYNINKLFLDQLVHVYELINLLEDCEEKVFLQHAVEQLVSLRKDEINLLDDHEAAMLLDFFPDLLGKDQKMYLLNKIKKEYFVGKLDHHYSHLLLRLFAKSLQTEHSFVDRVMLNRVMSACHKMRDKYSIGELTDIVHRLQQLRVYRQQMFDDIGDTVCNRSKQLTDGCTADEIGLLQMMCHYSHFHLHLCQNIEVSIEPSELHLAELSQFLFCCWTYNYEFLKEETMMRCVTALCQQLVEHHQPVSVDLYLELCLMLVTFDLHLLESLSDLKVVTSSECSRKLGIEKEETSSEVNELKVIMPLKEQDTGTFTASYALYWPLSRREVIDVIRQKWTPLPRSLETIYDKTGEANFRTKMFVEEFSLYLMSATSQYDVDRNCDIGDGLIVDFVISRKSKGRQGDNDDDNDVIIDNDRNEPRLAIKVLPPCVTIRNQPGLKQPASFYISCVQLKGYKILVVTTHGWKTVPHNERESYLKWKIDMTFSEKLDNDLLII